MGCGGSKESGDPWVLAASGQAKQLQRWLELGGNPSALDRQGGRGTLLHAAAQSDRVECIQVLLRAGADANAVTKLRGSPLHAAAEHGTQLAVAALLDGGADPLLKSAAGRTALDVAEARDGQAAATLLLRERTSRAASARRREEAEMLAGARSRAAAARAQGSGASGLGTPNASGTLPPLPPRPSGTPSAGGISGRSLSGLSGAQSTPPTPARRLSAASADLAAGTPPLDGYHPPYLQPRGSSSSGPPADASLLAPRPSPRATLLPARGGPDTPEQQQQQQPQQVAVTNGDAAAALASLAGAPSAPPATQSLLDGALGRALSQQQQQQAAADAGEEGGEEADAGSGSTAGTSGSGVSCTSSQAALLASDPLLTWVHRQLASRQAQGPQVVPAPPPPPQQQQQQQQQQGGWQQAQQLPPLREQPTPVAEGDPASAGAVAAEMWGPLAAAAAAAAPMPDQLQQPDQHQPQQGAQLPTGSGGSGSSGGRSTPTARKPMRSSSAAIVDIRPWEIQYSDLQLVRPIGEGSFGKVYLAKLHETLVAVKLLLDLEGITADGEGGEAALTLSNPILSSLQKECGLMASLRHPNVVQFMGVSAFPPAMVTEYCGKGSLTDVLKAGRASAQKAAALTWARRINLALDAAKGMLYLHKRGIIHRDLKSPNLLVDSTWRVKVADFNLSKILDESAALASSGASTGTMAGANPRWLAPEVLEGRATSAASDVFAYGVVMWELLTWSVPWERSLPWTVTAQVMMGARLPLPDGVQGLPGPAADAAAFTPSLPAYVALLQRCWAQEPAERPAFEEVIHELRKLYESSLHSRPAASS